MIFCTWILSPLITIIKTIITIVRTIVETICEWVSTVIHTVKTFVEKVCKWLPWPLNKLCNLVTKVIDIFETVWSWVCHTVIHTIFEVIEHIIVYIEYILKWVCWLIDWITFRWIDYVLCRLGFEPKRCLHICIKVLTDGENNPAATSAEVDLAITRAQAILNNCNVDIIEMKREFVEKPEFLNSTGCDFGNMFTKFFKWMSWNTCRCCNTVTVYIVNNMTNASGCAFPGTDFIIVARANGRPDPVSFMGNIMVQETGHLCDLWDHSSDPNNVMTDQSGGTSDQVTEHQCCIIRTSRFVSACIKRHKK